MVKRGTVLILILVFSLIVILHTVLQIVVYVKGVPFVYNHGFPQFSIKNVVIGQQFLANHPYWYNISGYILSGEWFLLSGFLFFYIYAGRNGKNKIKLIKDDNKFKDVRPHLSVEKYRKGKYSTDLDALYEMIKEKKNLKIDDIAQAFGVSQELAKSWCYTLEGGHLATVYSPRMGEQWIKIDDNSLNEKDKKGVNDEKENKES
ncbi:MAG: hypothetical protein AABX48_01780 [Nanoarchaeota archaeon]